MPKDERYYALSACLSGAKTWREPLCELKPKENRSLTSVRIIAVLSAEGRELSIAGSACVASACGILP